MISTKLGEKALALRVFVSYTAPPRQHETPDRVRGLGCEVRTPRSHIGTPRPILSRCLPNPRRVNRRAAGPDPESRSSASWSLWSAMTDGRGSSRRHTRTPALWAMPSRHEVGAYIEGRPDAENLVTGTAMTDVRRHAPAPAMGSVCPLPTSVSGRGTT